MVYFDLDNTLLDFSRSEKEALTSIFEEKGFDLTDELINQYVLINKKWWQYYAKGLYPKDYIVVARFEEFLNLLGRTDLNTVEIAENYLEKLSNLAYFLPGAEEFLEKLKSKGQRMAILTNGVQAVQEKRCKLLKLERFVEFVLTSEAVGKPKPDPTIFHVASKMSGVSLEKSVYVGDDPVIDFEASKNADVDFILFDPTGACSFSGKTVKNYDELLSLLL